MNLNNIIKILSHIDIISFVNNYKIISIIQNLFIQQS